jgi:hypothetical protein
MYHDSSVEDSAGDAGGDEVEQFVTARPARLVRIA